MKPAKALAQAASVGDLKTMRTMMKQAPSLAVEWQPIMDACFAGQAEAVELLLECGADPNISSKSAHHYRPLHRTVEYKKTLPQASWPLHGRGSTAQRPGCPHSAWQLLAYQRHCAVRLRGCSRIPASHAQSTPPQVWIFSTQAFLEKWVK